MLALIKFYKRHTVIFGLLMYISCSSASLFGVGLPFSKIDHFVHIENNSSDSIQTFRVHYGEHYFPNKIGKAFGPHIIGVHSMAMRVPDTVNVSWIEINKQSHSVDVPLKSLIKNRELRGSRFGVIFSVCNDKLTVYLDKKIAYLEYKRRQLWPQPSSIVSK